MARRMYSIDQINSEKPSDINIVAGNGINIDSSATSKTISLSLYVHNISISSYDDSMQAYMTVYSVNSAPVATKQELVDNLLMNSSMPATGTAETNTKFIFLMDSAGQLHYTDMAGNQNIYSEDYIVSDTVVAIGG